MKKYRIENVSKEIIEKINELLTFDLTDEHNFELIKSMFGQYIDFLKETDEPYSEHDFFIFCKEKIDDIKELMSDMDQKLEKIESSKFITFKVSIEGYEDNYRIIRINNIYNLKLLAYSILASFEMLYGAEYAVCYNGLNYYNPYCSFDEHDEEKLYDENTMLDSLNFDIDDELCLLYDDEYELNIKVTEISSYDDNKEGIELIKKHGVPFMLEVMDLFELLYNNDLEELKKKYKDPSFYEYYLDLYSKRNRKYSKSKFEKLIDDVHSVYEDEYDLDDEEYERRFNLLEEREQREIKLNKLPHIQEYQHAKELALRVVDKLSLYYNEHEEEFLYSASEMLKKDRKSNELSEELMIKQIRLDDETNNSIIMSYLFPLSKNYKSVAEIFKEEKKLVMEEYYMLNSLLNIKFGAYKILGYDIDNAIVLLQDMVTKEEFEIVDLNLSFGLDKDENWPIICARIVTYNTRSFFISGIFLMEDDELDEYLEKLKQRDFYHSLEFFINIAIIYEHQKAN